MPGSLSKDAITVLFVTVVLIFVVVRRVQPPPSRVAFDLVAAQLSEAGTGDAVASPPLPVLLLCVDALDPDDVLWPLADAGELGPQI